MSRTSDGGNWLDRLVAEAHDYLPHFGVLPRLSAEEVERYVALGKEGARRLRDGDLPGAESAFRSQLAILSINPEPHVSLAIVAEKRGDDKTALDHLKDAVVRGYPLHLLGRAEAWIRLRHHDRFRALQEAAGVLEEKESRWGAFSLYAAERTPTDAAEVFSKHQRAADIIELMTAALGPRLARLWNLRNDRSAAALLEAYIAGHPQAGDVGVALSRLIDLYTGGTFLRWEQLPVEVASRLEAVADLALSRQENALRPTALACRALARYSERDAKGALPARTVDRIRVDLEEVLTLPAGPVFLALAAEGLVRAEAEVGRVDRAAAQYRRFREVHATDPVLLATVRDRLGVLALRAGGLPEIRAVALDGTPVAPETLRGKVVVVDFWATWCRPCLAELPTLRRIVELYGEDVVVLGVNLDWSHDLPPEELVRWVAREKVPGRQLHDGRSWDSEFVKTFGVREIPMTVVAGPDGAILAVNEHGKGLEKVVDVAAAAVKLARSP